LRDRAINALATLLVNDESYFVRAYAAWSLGFFKNDERAFEAMSKARNQESVNDVVRERLYQGFEERKDPRAVPYAIEELESGLWHQGRGSAAHCLGRIGRDSPKALEALLKARNFANHYVRKEAALAVGDYGDPSALPELRSWLEKESTGSVARCVRESIYLLETKLKEREQAARVSAELEKLSEQTKMLEVKLNELANKGSNS
jgi:HEAT repeat protein